MVQERNSGKPQKEDSWEEVEAFFLEALSGKEHSRKRRKLEDLCTYLSHNWEGIKNARRSKVTVSAEAHVSHVL
jgi:hypothetical protein